jgi:PIN domain nuclease of toxin-antitoxin system
MFEERGQDVVIPVMEGALISSVNAAEVLRVFQRRGSSPANSRSLFEGLRLRVLTFDNDDATLAAEIGHAAPHLSLGDCACIALARRESADQVLTADKIWTETKLGVKIKLIR